MKYKKITKTEMRKAIKKVYSACTVFSFHNPERFVHGQRQDKL